GPSLWVSRAPARLSSTFRTGLVHSPGRTAAAQPRRSKSTQIRDDRAELDRLHKALEAVGQFMPTDDTAVSAAKRAADAATKSREAECGTTEKQRGNNCRAREADERAANDT